MFRSPFTLLVSLAMLAFPSLGTSQETAKALKAGIIGLDTSHVVAFTKLLNNPKNAGDLASVRVVAAYPGSSHDLPDSRDRVAGFTQQLREQFGVEIVDSIEALLPKVDVVLLESVDGRPHLEQVKPVLRAGKSVFIDKPVAGSLADAIQIFDLAQKQNVPVFSSSSLRFSPGIAGLRNNPRLGEVLGCDAYGPCALEKHHPDLFWYGIHGVEALFTIMGTGCESVVRVQTKDTELITGTWKGGRVGTFRGIRSGKSGYGATVFGSKDILPSGGFGGYEPLVIEICKFFKTGKPPVRAAETIEIFAFMEAADESKRLGGVPVKLETVLAKARAQASIGENNAFSKWEKAIAAFEKQDAEKPPPANAILFVGSSSIRLWNLSKSFPDMEAINRGFGGSQLADSVHFAPRIILKHRPRMVVLYSGDNDLAFGKMPEQVAADFQAFVKAIHQDLPQTRIAFISVKPSLARWRLVDKIQQINALIKASCQGDERLVYVDVFQAMLGEDGKPRRELFAPDGLHLNEKGYQLWATVLKPYLK